MNNFRWIATVCLMAVMFGCVIPVMGAPMYSEDFTGSDGSMPDGWLVLSGTTSQEITNNTYHMWNGGTKYPLCAYTGQNSIFPLPEIAAWQDYTAEADFMTDVWKSEQGAKFGMLVRYNASSTSNDRYFYSVLINGNKLEIAKDRNYVSSATTVATSTETFTYNVNEWWHLEVVASGRDETTITASLFDAADQLQATVSFTDSSPGYRKSGSVGYINWLDTNQDIYWDNLQVVPEPATLSLLSLLGIAQWISRR